MVTRINTNKNMKKIFMMAMAFCAMQVSMADNENLLQVVPLHIPVGQEVNYDEKDALLQVYLNSEAIGSGVEFDIYIPDVLEFDPEDINLEKEVVPYKGAVPRYHTTYMNVYKDEYQTMPGYTRIVYRIYDSARHNFSASEGVVCSFNVGTSSTATPGVYPVYLGKQDILTADAEHIGSNFGAMTVSYVVVGEPSEGAFAATNIVPSKVNEALAVENAITSLDLSAVTAINGTFTYVDGREVEGTTATAAVKYVGNKANYYSVNVPFTGTATGEFYELKSVDENFAVFSTATTVKAGETYLAKGEVTLTANAAVATIENKENQTGSYVYEGMFYTGKNLTVPATRGLFKEVPAGSNLRVVIDGELTGITTAEIDAQTGNTYDLQGRQSVNAKNGVFVVNGKKQFVK